MAGIPSEGLVARETKIRDEMLNGARVILFENDIAIAAGTVFADLEEPTWDNYAPVETEEWSTIALDSLGNALCVAPTAFFENASGDDQEVYGWAVVSVDDVILDGDRFAGAPITIPDGFTHPVTVLDRLRRVN